jgi:hypothetical protein
LLHPNIAPGDVWKGLNKVTLFASRVPNVCTVGNIDLLAVVSDSFASIMALGNGSTWGKYTCMGISENHVGKLHHLDIL